MRVEFAVRKKMTDRNELFDCLEDCNLGKFDLSCLEGFGTFGLLAFLKRITRASL